MKLHSTALLAALSGIAALFAAPACAQSDWTIGGITFDKRDGWCSKPAVQDGIHVLEIRPCGADFPYLSVGIIAPPEQGKGLDVASLLAGGMKNASSDENRASILKLATDKYGACTTTSFLVDEHPIPGIAGYATLASYNCPKAPDNPKVDYRNFGTLIRQPNGAVWGVAFDYPVEPLTPQDSAMISSAIGRIAAAAN